MTDAALQTIDAPVRDVARKAAYPMAKKQKKQYRMDVQCPHCGTHLKALSPADRVKPVDVQPDGMCNPMFWLTRVCRFTEVECPDADCRMGFRLMWCYVKWEKPKLFRRRTRYTTVK